jgi:hypothetical protein
MALAIVCAVPVLSAQNVKEKFTGFAINMNGAANTATVDFTIERWSTDAERKTLLSLIPEEHKDPQKLVRALQDMKSVGSLRTPQTLAWDAVCEALCERTVRAFYAPAMNLPEFTVLEQRRILREQAKTLA